LPFIENIVSIGNIYLTLFLLRVISKKKGLIPVALQLCVIVALGSSSTPEKVEIQSEVSAVGVC